MALRDLFSYLFLCSSMFTNESRLYYSLFVEWLLLLFFVLEDQMSNNNKIFLTICIPYD